MQRNVARFQPAELRGDQRLLLLGKTNSGKSFMARYLLKLAFLAGWRIVIVDPKKDWQGRGEEKRAFGGKKPWKEGTVDHPVLVERFNPKLRVQIIQPVSWDKSMDAMAKAIMAVGNVIIYFDEVTQLVKVSAVPQSFKILWTQGRSINVGAWSGSQRPVSIPEDIKSQAEVWFIFRLIKLEDRQVVEGYVPEAEQIVEKALPYRYFWFYEDSMDAPVLVAPLKLVKRGAHDSDRAGAGGQALQRVQA